jgi:crotonobetainyl-CoA:carnitine CoA-transferase CaiB-like acyl-CoA transferase
MMLEGILAGIRVLDLTQNVAGPFCSQILGDMGAEVIKVERPGAGDDSRSWRSPQPGSVSPHFIALNRNKRSICVDVGTPEGREVLTRLAAGCHVFLHSMKPGSAEARGFGYDELSREHAALVYCAVSAYGETGPLKELPGYDPVMQAFSGLMSLCGSAGDEPSRVPVSIVDVGTGMWAAIGILGACLQQARTGTGARVQVSLLETSLAWMNALITSHALSGRPPDRLGTSLANAAPYELFRAADGHVLIAAPNDRLFAAACRALELPLLPHNPRFATNAVRLENRAELHRLVEERTAALPVSEVVNSLRAAAVPCGEMNGFEQAMGHPQVKAVGMMGGWSRQASIPPLVEMPLRMDGERSQAREPPPRLGEHTTEVLRAAGFSDGEIESLRGKRVIA